jgi:hypothetical protein
LFKERVTFFVRAQNLLNQRYKLAIPVDMNDANSLTFKGSLQDPLRIMAGCSLSF